MKLHILILILIFTSLAFAQTKRTVSPAPKSKYATGSFDIGNTTLPRVFEGHNAAMIYSNLQWMGDSTCGKFEKTEDCHERIYNKPPILITPGTKSDDTLAFSIKLDECDYSADEEIMTCHIPATTDYSTSGIDFLWSSRLVSSSAYIGTNAFGVKRRVSQRKYETVNVRFGHQSISDFKIKVEPTSAPFVVYNMRILLIGRAIPPWVERNSRYSKPTIDDPKEIYLDNMTISVLPKSVWLYEYYSGKIYSKARAGI